ACAFVEEIHDKETLPLPQNAPYFLSAKAAYSRAYFMGPGRGWVDAIAEKKVRFWECMPGFLPWKWKPPITWAKIGKKC
ncbi:hypothetical protein, partial [Arsenophonus endosymbiont of Bemisia tabaci]|uniref:hypothetical protein n=1 Tax=Arsenophonus endosymbiont of Bemisia tabaci TaxID=536059 RepID=UPI001EE1A8F4